MMYIGIFIFNGFKLYSQTDTTSEKDKGYQITFAYYHSNISYIKKCLHKVVFPDWLILSKIL